MCAPSRECVFLCVRVSGLTKSLSSDWFGGASSASPLPEMPYIVHDVFVLEPIIIHGKYSNPAVAPLLLQPSYKGVGGGGGGGGGRGKAERRPPRATDVEEHTESETGPETSPTRQSCPFQRAAVDFRIYAAWPGYRRRRAHGE